MIFLRALFTGLTVGVGLLLADTWHDAGWPTTTGNWVACFLWHSFFMFLFFFTIKVYVEDD
jgi:hypothetical protein